MGYDGLKLLGKIQRFGVSHPAISVELLKNSYLQDHLKVFPPLLGNFCQKSHLATEHILLNPELTDLLCKDPMSIALAATENFESAKLLLQNSTVFVCLNQKAPNYFLGMIMGGYI